MKNFSHLVEINPLNRTLSIYRVDEKGDKELYTSTDLPDIDIDVELKGFRDFATLVGENILLDSPVIRKLFNI